MFESVGMGAITLSGSKTVVFPKLNFGEFWYSFIHFYYSVRIKIAQNTKSKNFLKFQRGYPLNRDFKGKFIFLEAILEISTKSLTPSNSSFFSPSSGDKNALSDGCRAHISVSKLARPFSQNSKSPFF